MGAIKGCQIFDMRFERIVPGTAILSMSDAGLFMSRGRQLEPRLFLSGLVNDYPAQKAAQSAIRLCLFLNISPRR